MWVCTSVEVYERNHLGPKPPCPVNFHPPMPPPGQCRLVNGTCQYAQPAVTCRIWYPDCEFRYTCGTTEEWKRNSYTCPPFISLPPPDTLCIPINNTCRWYNPCRYWKNSHSSGYSCGSLDQYYKFIFGLQPPSIAPPEELVETQPPGDCVIVNGECAWSSKWIREQACSIPPLCDSPYWNVHCFHVVVYQYFAALLVQTCPVSSSVKHFLQCKGSVPKIIHGFLLNPTTAHMMVTPSFPHPFTFVDSTSLWITAYW